jgi:hypothetical protein
MDGKIQSWIELAIVSNGGNVAISSATAHLKEEDEDAEEDTKEDTSGNIDGRWSAQKVRRLS